MDNEKLNSFDSDMSINDYIYIFSAHFKKVIFIIVIGTIVATYFTFTTHPIYEASTSVIIREKPGSSMVMNIGGQKADTRMTNEIQLIKSRKVAKEVIRRLWENEDKNSLNIFGTRVFYPKGERIRRIIRELATLGIYDSKSEIAKSYDSKYSDEIGERYASKVIKNVYAVHRKSTDIIDISFQSVYANEAKKIANIIANVYRDFEKEISTEDANLSVLFLTDLVKQQEEKLVKSEELIKNYQIENNIFDTEGSAKLVADQLSTLENEIYNNVAEINMRKEKISFLESKLTENEKNLANKISSDINAQMLVIRTEITGLESKLMQNTILYGENHGAVLDLKRKINALKFEIDKKVKTLIERGVTVEDPLLARQKTITELLSLNSEIFTFDLKRQETLKLKDIYTNKLNQLPEKQLNLSRLKRDEDVLTQNYVFIRQQLEAAKIRAASEGGKVQIIDKARKPQKPISPNHNKDVLKGFILSIAIAILFVFIIEFFDNSIRKIQDIDRLGLSILGIIPAIGKEANLNKSSFLKKTFGYGKPSNSLLRRRLITREDPRSPISESYRSLRTSLMYTDIDKDTKSILVSSAGPGEGKTTTVANMAITYANLGKKTLLIDTDLRRPVVHKVLELNKEPGITNYLAGNVDDFSSLVQKTDIDNLYVVTSGIIPPNPSELLGSTKMSDLIRSLEKNWDMVLFDSPPLVAVTDATMVSQDIDKIVIVVKVGQTDKRAFEHTIQALKNVKAPIGGVVLNAVTQKNSYGSYYYYYQYYHYYGSENKV